MKNVGIPNKRKMHILRSLKGIKEAASERIIFQMNSNSFENCVVLKLKPTAFTQMEDAAQFDCAKYMSKIKTQIA